MRTTITSFVMCLLLCTSFTLQAQLNTPRGSQMASVMQRIGTTDVTITYSRPSVRDREVWGKLVPFGLNDFGFGTSKAAPWRAGANENTLITFTHDAKVEGKAITAGTYGLHINVKDADNATLILSKDTEAWGSYFYDPSNDALRVDVKLKDIPHTELLTYAFDQVGADYAVAELQWEKKAIPFKIEVDVRSIVTEDLRSKLTGQNAFISQHWEQAANWLLNNDGDLDEALAWINKGLEGQFFSQKTFNGLVIKANILNKKGDSEGFGSTLDEAFAMSNPNQINRLGYLALQSNDYNRAIQYFNSNVKNSPDSANWHGSLADAYKAKGDKKLAIKHYKKALSLNPNARVKARVEKGLKEVTAS
ncbi:DUF2911 domain-containing protein [Winogradskyella jejuensis]|uniref:Tetratricopeptide repeat-containing protein n=1 Tax=Winogradskyella jejuensis TaxID=1089305 RepID=A0A1M5US54_9FLAO|nr:DUF2911 domain-containing protein [Winogradskyella jejuensis]SHH65754.1 Tetratricopeptide repeat-containing protein [Winogradskyella jejuensis]